MLYKVRYGTVPFLLLSVAGMEGVVLVPYVPPSNCAFLGGKAANLVARQPRVLHTVFPPYLSLPVLYLSTYSTLYLQHIRELCVCVCAARVTLVSGVLYKYLCEDDN
ncbi:hypothetical protein HOY80DRAFT_996189 [Tuber brumale]|nr:hypothetical protein HOY80DRAFT_996189 [Tuber brumale]